MRRETSGVLSLPKLPTLILTILILSAMSYAVAPDRITGPIVAARSVRLKAGVPMKARPEFDRGRVDPSLEAQLHMTLLTVPSPDQQKALTKLLADQQDPHSNLYHKWLTPEAYADRFGLSQGDVKKLTAWLQSQGFTVVKVARGRNHIVFSGSAIQAENAFQTQLHTYEVDGEKHFANSTPAAIPAALSGVVSAVRGLNNFHPKAQARHARPGYTFPYQGSNYLFVAPGDLATMYDLNPLYTAGIDGTGQTLAVIGQTDVFQADLTAFRTGFGLSPISCTTNSNDIITACNTSNFRYILVNADPGTPGPDLGEADIDLEWSGAVAKNAQIIYVNAPDPNGGGVYDSLYYTVDNNVSPVMTMSYTAPCELAEIGYFESDEAELQMANTQGITFMNSSGDTGAAECDFGSNLATYGYAMAYPASSQYATGVGGTMIPTSEYNSTYWGSTNGADGGSALSYIPEQGWNDSQEFGVICTPTDPCNFGGQTVTDWASAQDAIGISAGGGGVSNCVTANSNGRCLSGFPRPSYQQGLVIPGTIPGETTSPSRLSPDVSLPGSANFPGYLVCTDGSCSAGVSAMLTGCFAGTGPCSIFGGTSVSSPAFAGIVALLNQYVVQNGFQGSAGFGNINPTLYSIAATPANGAFHQVTTGSNGVFCSPGTPSGQLAALQCPSTGSNAGFLGFDASNFDPITGYNLVTGLGSVDASLLAIAWVPSAVGLSPVVLNFGDQSIATTSAPQNSTMTNHGSATIHITSVRISGANAADFAETNTCGSALPVGSSCSISVTFTPTANGTRTAEVTISDDAPGSPQIVSLTGFGVTITTTTSIKSSPNPAALGQTVTSTAFVLASNGGSPTGTVEFYDGSALLGAVPLNLGSAKWTSSTFLAGSHSLSAAYSGDSAFPPSTSPVVVEVVKRGLPLVRLISSPNPSYIGQTVAFTATIAGVAGVTPTGSVSFQQGALVLGTVQLSNGIVVYSTAFDSNGARSITASYSGDPNYVTKKSKPLKQVVNKYTSTASASSSLNPSAYGQAVNLTSVVSSSAPSQPTGTVTFKNGPTSLGTVPVVNGSALLTKTSLPAGNLSITAVYNGDPLNNRSVSPTLAQLVSKASTTTSITSSPNPSVAGQNVKFKAVVLSPSTIPVGTVTFSIGNTILGTVSLAGGKAAFTTSTLPVGTNKVKAKYNGTANIAGSSGVVTQTVQ